jgi:hypothetical protein
MNPANLYLPNLRQDRLPQTIAQAETLEFTDDSIETLIVEVVISGWHSPAIGQ